MKTYCKEICPPKLQVVIVTLEQFELWMKSCFGGRFQEKTASEHRSYIRIIHHINATQDCELSDLLDSLYCEKLVSG